MKELKKYLNMEDFKVILKDVGEVIQGKKNYLCEIDSFVGYGDHGMTIASGFDHALEEIRTNINSKTS